MSSIIIADAGPLIALAKIDHLNLLHQMYGEVLIPPAIFKELAVDSQKLNAIKPVPLLRGIKEKYLSCKPPERSETHHFRRFGGFRSALPTLQKSLT
jgi:hypothetical protein